jgi:hypothetical protein
MVELLEAHGYEKAPSPLCSADAVHAALDFRFEI